MRMTGIAALLSWIALGAPGALCVASGMASGMASDEEGF